MTVTSQPNGFVPGHPALIVRDGVSLQVTPTPDYLPFWRRVANGLWEPHTLRVLRRFLRPDETMLDIGAWIGPTVLFGAHYSREVIALEPDPVAFNELAGNLALNSDIKERVGLVPACLAPTTSPVHMYCGGFHHTGTSSFGDSMTSLLPHPNSVEQEAVVAQGVDIDVLDSHFDFRRLGFMKLDVEGGEYLLLPTLERFLSVYRPTLFVSFHMPPSAYREQFITESFATLARVYPHVYSASGQEVPLRELLGAGLDWSVVSRSNPAALLMTVARSGLVATFDTW